MVDKSAIIDKGAILGEGVAVGPYAVIGKNVKLGKRVFISPHAQIKGKTEIKENTFIGYGAVIGEMPQMLSLRENRGNLTIGKNNTLREYVTIHTSTAEDKTTTIGDNNYLMGFSHLAHDCCLKDNIVICNGALLAGHITVEDSVFISGNVVIHQFVRIGQRSMIGGLSRVNQDVPPFMTVVGDSRVWGVNSVGLRRANFSRDDLAARKLLSILYRSKLSVKQAVDKLKTIDSDKVKQLIDFILSSKRGICGPKKSTFFEKIFLDYPYFLRNTIPTYRKFLKAK